MTDNSSSTMAVDDRENVCYNVVNVNNHSEGEALRVKKGRTTNQPTVDTIAGIAGVSAMTVSRVFSNYPHVREDTKKKVLSVAKRLRYTPNISARMLASRTSHVIGLIVQSHDLFASYYLIGILRGIESVLDSYADTDRAHSLVLFSHVTDSPRGFQDIMQWYSGGLIKGFIVIAPTVENSVLNTLVKDMRANFVVIGSNIKLPHVECITIDNFKGGYLAAEHLIQLGHRDIGFLRGPSGRQDTEEREKGFRKALTDNRVRLQGEFMGQGDFEEKKGYLAMKQMLSRKRRPTAVFASNDLMAFGAMTAAHELGLRVPEDLSIVGFDNIEFAQMSNPPLTTIHHHVEELGVVAARRLIEGRKEGESPFKTIYGVHLIKRDSTAPLKK